MQSPGQVINCIQAMISYVLQAVTTFLFGPLLANLVLIFRLEVAKPSKRVTKWYTAATRIAYSVTKTNMYVSLAIAIASILRTYEISLGEHDFIVWLGNLQVFILAGAFVSFLTYQHVGKATTVIYGAYGILVTTIMVVNVFKIVLPSSQFLEQILASVCVYEGSYPIFQDLVEQNNQSKWSMFLGIYAAMGILIIIIALLLSFFFKRAKTALESKIKHFYDEICRLFRIKAKHLFSYCGVFLVTLCWAGCTIWFLHILVDNRNMIQASSNPPNADAQWGFGQITAVMAWGPLLHDIILELIGRCPDLNLLHLI